MNFIGENLLPGQLGSFFVILSLGASLLASIAYALGTSTKDESNRQAWIKTGRIAFAVEVLSVISIFSCLFFIIHNHLFEYKYAWQHSSISLETKYLLACFWEGQEGSFMLWSGWHCVLGLLLIFKARSWEAPVMSVISFAQFCLATMIGGIYIAGVKIGSSPFTLLRNELEAPIFSRPDYLSLIKDGNGLNPLLQNYWMVIHPPVLFMGFAAAIVPFAYAISGLWTKKYVEWVRPALPWALFSCAVLGTGIMMGAMWAYESLTFGGYWAWDPVENASLVPWLILVAGIHTMVIYRHTGRSLRISVTLIISAYLLVLYATFLTRSGILGDSSVHAFTDLGMNTQLLLFLAVFLLAAITLLLTRYRYIPHIVKEEEASSREFWMFMGSLVLLISAVTIIVMTSIPVINKIAGILTGHDRKLFKPLAIGSDSEYAYNKIQIYIAIAIGLLTGITQYLKYKKTNGSYLLGKLVMPIALSILISSILFLLIPINYHTHGTEYLAIIRVAVFMSVYGACGNFSYIYTGLKGRIKYSGASVSHAGFCLMLLGVLISASKKEILSLNPNGRAVALGEGSNEMAGENLTLVQGQRTSMNQYWVTYIIDSAHEKKPLWFYKINFERKDRTGSFDLSPNAFVNYKGVEGLMSNPDARHFWNHDVFVYITSLPDPAQQPSAAISIKSVAIGDTFSYEGAKMVVEAINIKANIQDAGLEPGDTASIAMVKTYTPNSPIEIVEPILIRRNGQSYFLQDTASNAKMVFQLVSHTDKQVSIGIQKIKQQLKYVTLKAYKFPFINVVWIGVIITVLGFCMSIRYRIKKAY